MFSSVTSAFRHSWPVALLLGFQLQASDKFPDYSMVLVGGGLKSCSSMSPAACKAGFRFAADALSESRYGWSEQAQRRLASQPHWSAQREGLRQQLLQAVASLPKAAAPVLLTEAELLVRLGQELTRQLSDAEYNLVLDQLQQPVWHQHNKPASGRKWEQVSLENSTDEFSREIYIKIVEQADKVKKSSGKPKVLILTASSRDPFAAVDFYLELFRQAGADVEWLPLNASWQQAQQQSVAGKASCDQLDSYLETLHHSYNRAAVYPDLFQQLQDFCQAGTQAALDKIHSADALFFNGGNQSLTLAAFFTEQAGFSAEYAAIRKQLSEGRLIVAGSSAGTAVMAGGLWQQQAVPMISNGSSKAALLYGARNTAAPAEGCELDQSCPAGISSEHLTYRAAGGLGYFHYGVLDTHFSERGRQARLAQLMQHSQTRYGFGVDEATALLVGWPDGNRARAQMQVIGAAGVYVLEQPGDNKAAATDQTKPAGLRFISHYLTRDDRLRLDEDGLSIEFAHWKQPQKWQSAIESQPTREELNWLQGDGYRQLASRICRLSFDGLSSVEPATGFKVSLQAGANSKAAAGRYPAPSAQHHYCSYQAIELQISAPGLAVTSLP